MDIGAEAQRRRHHKRPARIPDDRREQNRRLVSPQSHAGHSHDARRPQNLNGLADRRGREDSAIVS
jgi:hypothetical protein